MKEVVAMLQTKPIGVGRPVSDRVAWEKLAGLDSFKKMVRDAESLSKEPIPEQPDELFLDYSKTGNRVRWEAVARKRRGRLRVFALAECLENQGRFVKPLEDAIEAVCQERTWVMPAHDRNLENFHGKSVNIDLVSSAIGWELATIDYLLADKLSAKTRKMIRDNVRKRVLDPFLAMIRGKREKDWWLTTTNNWNAVCLAGVVGTSLAIVESREERAEFIRAGIEYSKNYLKGFGADGYCSEGLAYWNYGFGSYVALAETVMQVTGGKIDMFRGKEVGRPAAFGEGIEIMNGVYPAFADCNVDVQPDVKIMAYLNRKYGLGLSGAGNETVSAQGPLSQILLHGFPNSASGMKTTLPKRSAAELRTWFDSSGILICRPGKNTACRMGVALKGGHNAEHHNHNDVGSFVVVVGKSPVLLDPGSEVYTGRTFSDKRYDSKVLNSFGHPVPVVAGKLQQAGREAYADVIRTEFTEESDTLVIDIKSAYPVKELKKLVRTFIYSRSGKGSLTVIDEVEFSTSREFGNALITLGEWKKEEDGKISVSDGVESVLVDIKVNGAEFSVSSEELKEEVRTKKLPMRIGINLARPVTGARIVLRITS